MSENDFHDGEDHGQISEHDPHTDDAFILEGDLQRMTISRKDAIEGMEYDGEMDLDMEKRLQVDYRSLSLFIRLMSVGMVLLSLLYLARAPVIFVMATVKGSITLMISSSIILAINLMLIAYYIVSGIAGFRSTVWTTGGRLSKAEQFRDAWFVSVFFSSLMDLIGIFCDGLSSPAWSMPWQYHTIGLAISITLSLACYIPCLCCASGNVHAIIRQLGSDGEGHVM